MKRYFLLLFLFTALILYAQDEPAENIIPVNSLVAGTDSMTIAAEEPVKELTEEELLCKQSADDLMKIYENWDVTRDYDILLPRITSFVNGYFKMGIDPDELNSKDLISLKELYEKLFPVLDDEFQKNLVILELERINAELSGKQKNPALIGYVDKMDFDRLKAIEDHIAGSNDPAITPLVADIRSIYRNIRRYSISFDDMLNNIYSEVTRVTDKRIYFLYMETEVEEGLLSVSGILAQYVQMREEEFKKQIKENVDGLYKKKNEAVKAGNSELEKSYYNQWIEARKVNIDKVMTDDISRLSGIMSNFLESPGVYDINHELVFRLKIGSSETKEYFMKILKVKFFHDLNSKFKTYSRFSVEKGFRSYRSNVLVGSFMFFILFFYVYFTVRKKRESIFIRRIPGLDAIDDAVGRATEMGKPIIYDSGIGAFINPQTIASMLILKSVAKKVAEFKAEIIYPAYDPIVLQVAEEMIASGFLDAGYPEDHKKDNCFFMVQDQFAFAAGLAGLIARKKPATALHFGSYAAESLLISEAGFAAGAIQVAGTVEASQLPFFITACDYTLIGEELYAAAAYLSRDAQILSNLKLSDYGKILFGILFLLGTILLTINSEWTIIADILDTY